MSHSTPSDQVLVAKVLTGDSSAWCVLVCRHQATLTEQVMGLLPQEAERNALLKTLVKATFLAARRTLGDYPPEKPFSAWLFQIAFRLVARQQLEHGRQGPSQEQGMAAIDRLPPELREVLVLKDLEGLDYAEVAAVLGQEVDIVRQNHHRARLELAKLLQGQH